MSGPRLVPGVLLALVGAAWLHLAQGYTSTSTGGSDGPAAGVPRMAGALGKPAAPVRLSVTEQALPEGAGEFVVEVAVWSLAPHESLALTAWGAEGVSLDGPGFRELGPGPEGRVGTWVLTGEWTGQGPPRLYVRAEARGAFRSGGRSLSVQVSRTEYRPAGQGRLDEERGELVWQVE